MDSGPQQLIVWGPKLVQVCTEVPGQVRPPVLLCGSGEAMGCATYSGATVRRAVRELRGFLCALVSSLLAQTEGCIHQEQG